MHNAWAVRAARVGLPPTLGSAALDCARERHDPTIPNSVACEVDERQLRQRARGERACERSSALHDESG